MDHYLRIPLLASLKRGQFCLLQRRDAKFYFDRTISYLREISTRMKFREHFISILSLSQIVGTTLSAENIP